MTPIDRKDVLTRFIYADSRTEIAYMTIVNVRNTNKECYCPKLDLTQ